MEIKIRKYGLDYAEATFKIGNTTIKEDVELKDAEEFITAANEINRAKSISDVEFVKNIYDCFLNDEEKQQFLELTKG